MARDLNFSSFPTDMQSKEVFKKKKKKSKLDEHIFLYSYKEIPGLAKYQNPNSLVARLSPHPTTPPSPSDLFLIRFIIYLNDLFLAILICNND